MANDSIDFKCEGADVVEAVFKLKNALPLPPGHLGYAEFSLKCDASDSAVVLSGHYQVKPGKQPKHGQQGLYDDAARFFILKKYFDGFVPNDGEWDVLKNSDEYKLAEPAKVLFDQIRWARCHFAGMDPDVIFGDDDDGLEPNCVPSGVPYAFAKALACASRKSKGLEVRDNQLRYFERFKDNPYIKR